eukprot:PhM_4_TR4159/c2_g1_i2/m.73939
MMVGMGFDRALVEAQFNVSGVYGVFAHDAVFHGMSSLHSYVRNMTAQALHVDKITYLREHESIGATGLIHLKANGDRSTDIDMAIHNVDADGVMSMIGAVRNGTFSAVDTRKGFSLYTLGKQWTAMPSGMHPEPESDSSSNGTQTITIMLVSIIAGLLVVVVIGVIVTRSKQRVGRDNATAVKDSTQPFAVVFTDIESSTSLWARVPEVMSDAVELHHTSIRRLIVRHQGYEVKTIGDSFMVVFSAPLDAVEFSLDVQSTLHSLKWPLGDAIDRAYADMALERSHSDPSNHELWNGLRVRIGINFGTGSVQLDPVTGGYDYYGTVVNTAARVESVGHGGQVIVTSAVLDGLHGDLKGRGISVLSFGAQSLRGLDEPLELHQLVRMGCATERREYPAASGACECTHCNRRKPRHCGRWVALLDTERTLLSRLREVAVVRPAPPPRVAPERRALVPPACRATAHCQDALLHQ